MSKRILWILVVLFCVTFVALRLAQSRLHLAQGPRNGEAPSETSSQPLTEEVQLNMAPARSSGAAEPFGADDKPPPQEVKALPAEALNQQPTPSPTDSTPAEPTRIRPSGTALNRDAGPDAEVWSYPPLLQQNASNNFVRVMGKLAGARSDLDRYLAFGEAAQAYFIFGRIEESRSFANELLLLDERFKGEPWRDGSAVYTGNLILGRIAVLEGRMEQAKEHLLKAGTSTGSPTLGSFGPNMSLARDLLHRGEQETVLEFFELCRKFWTLGEEKLTLWSEGVRAGRMPDFGANLLY